MNAQIDISGIRLTTERLILRPWQVDDLADLFAYASVDGVGQMAGWTPHKDMEESRTILSHFISGKHIFALVYQGKVIGSLGIECYNEAVYPELASLQGREIGYVLSKDYWGSGLMPEAVGAAIQYLFESVTLDFITVGHFIQNDRSRRVIESWIRGYEQENYYQWMITVKEEGDGPIGSISVVELSEMTESAEIGYCIGKKWWHKHLMSEALDAVIRFLITQAGFQRITARHDLNDPHSGGVMRKCGMRYEGTTRRSARNNQGICDMDHYAILRGS